MPRQAQRSREAGDASGAGAEIFRIQGGHAGLCIQRNPAHRYLQYRQQAKHVSEAGWLFTVWTAQTLAGEHVAVSAALQGPLQHELGLQLQAAASSQLDGFQVVADVEAIPISPVSVPSKLGFFCANGCICDSGEGKLAIEQDLGAAAVYLGYATVIHNRHHLAGHAPRCSRGERIIGEGDLFSRPAVFLNPDLGTLEADAADRAPFVGGRSVLLPSIVKRIGGVYDGHQIKLESCAPALLECHITHSLLACRDLLSYFRAHWN